jgi:hypothetical protein
MNAALIWLLLMMPPPDDPSGQLLELRRVYVDKFPGEGGAHLREMVISALQRAGLFRITENAARADAVMRGSGEDLVFTDTFQSGESVGARGTFSAGSGKSQYNRNTIGLSTGITESEQTRIVERKHEASAAVRLVNKDGDVIWSTTQESLGAKFKSASADVADKIVKQLLQDYEKARGRH